MLGKDTRKFRQMLKYENCPTKISMAQREERGDGGGVLIRIALGIFVQTLVLVFLHLFVAQARLLPIMLTRVLCACDP